MDKRQQELLPCPFCGGEPIADDLGDPADDSFIHCSQCEVQQIANYTPEEAARRWNTRLTPTPSDGDGDVVETWQPIETAPKDGTWFVAACFGYGEPDYEVGCFDPLLHDRFVPAEQEGLYRKEREKIYDWRGFSNMHRMTHWMPLPQPPALSTIPPLAEGGEE